MKDTGYGIDNPSKLNPINWLAKWFGGDEAPGARYNNCSSYACSEWNRNTGEQLTCSSFWGCADTPGGLGRSIDRANKPLPDIIYPYMPYPYMPYPYMSYPYMPYP